MDELNYLVKKLGKYLGGIDVEKAFKDNEEVHKIYVMRELKLDHEPPGDEINPRARLMLLKEMIEREIKREQTLIADAKMRGIPQSNIPNRLKQLIRMRRKIMKMMREMQ
jgi:hypothetical protein